MFHLTDVEDIKSVYDSHFHLNRGQLDIKRIMTFIPSEAKVTLETIKDSEEDK
jgi:hypothetical protein